MNAIQRNEDKTLQYILKLIPDFGIFDMIESKYANTITKTGEKYSDNIFYYDPSPIITEKKYVINSNFNRAIFRFSFLKNFEGQMIGGPIVSNADGLHIAVDENNNFIIDKDGYYIIHNANNEIVGKHTRPTIKIISLDAIDNMYNSFIIDNGLLKYMIIIDERGDNEGCFNIRLNNYFLDNGSNLQSVIGVCF